MNPKRLTGIAAKSKKTWDASAAGPGGFTLVELLVAMAVASIMLAAMVSLFLSLNKSYTRQNAAAEVQQVTRAGVDFMAQSIRMAGLDPEQTGAFGITVAEETSITFQADFDLDGNNVPPLLPEPGEEISFWLNGDRLLTTLDAAPLVENVDTIIFTYLAADNSILATPVANPADIRTVRIALTVREPAGHGKTLARTYATEVRCRNIGL